MIQLLGLSVNQLGDSKRLCCSLSTNASGLLKARTVFGTPNQCGQFTMLKSNYYYNSDRITGNS
jgi:hypothetical protein